MDQNYLRIEVLTADRPTEILKRFKDLKEELQEKVLGVSLDIRKQNKGYNRNRDKRKIFRLTK